MSNFSEIFTECLKSKNNEEVFNNNLELLFANSQVKKELISHLQASYSVSENDIKTQIKEQLEEHNYKKAPEFATFKRNIRDRLNDLNIDNTYFLNEAKIILDHFKNAGIPTGDLIILKKIFNLIGEERIEKENFLNDLLNKSGNDPKYIYHIKFLFNRHNRKDLKKIIDFLCTFSFYTRLVNKIICDKKLKIPNLILDFNKIRDYLYILLNENVTTKKAFIEKCNWKKTNSYEKEVRRILDLFNSDKTIFELKEDLKNYKPSEFLKIYDIHTVPNLLVNFIILDILQKNNIKVFKLKFLIEKLFPLDESNDKQEKEEKELTIKKFKKYTLLPRLKEMQEYGFINIDNDKYTFCATCLNENQKNILKYVVPFFCGIYPFPSIGHFLASRLDTNNIFEVETYNTSNFIDDCIAYDLLEAINNKKNVTIKFKGKKSENNHKKIRPTELFIDKDNHLRIKDKENEYLLSQINEVLSDGRSHNPIFNEIYSFYYKVFEDSIKKYNQKKAEQLNNTAKKTYWNYFPNKYEPYKNIFDFSTFNKLLPMMTKLDSAELPMTLLELRWLKTIMQDPLFDLFVTSENKQSLAELVSGVDIFDLSKFKWKANKKDYTDFIKKNLVKIKNIQA